MWAVAVESQGIEEFFAHVHDGVASAPTSQCLLTLPTASSTREASEAIGKSKRIGKSGQKTSIPWEFSGRNDPSQQPHPYVADITDVASSTRIRTPSPTRYGTNAPMLWCATNFSNHATVP